MATAARQHRRHREMAGAPEKRRRVCPRATPTANLAAMLGTAIACTAVVGWMSSATVTTTPSAPRHPSLGPVADPSALVIPHSSVMQHGLRGGILDHYRSPRSSHAQASLAAAAAGAAAAAVAPHTASAEAVHALADAVRALQGDVALTLTVQAVTESNPTLTEGADVGVGPGMRVHASADLTRLRAAVAAAAHALGGRGGGSSAMPAATVIWYVDVDRTLIMPPSRRLQSREISADAGRGTDAAANAAVDDVVVFDFVDEPLYEGTDYEYTLEVTAYVCPRGDEAPNGGGRGGSGDGYDTAAMPHWLRESLAADSAASDPRACDGGTAIPLGRPGAAPLVVRATTPDGALPPRMPRAAYMAQKYPNADPEYLSLGDGGGGGGEGSSGSDASEYVVHTWRAHGVDVRVAFHRSMAVGCDSDGGVVRLGGSAVDTEGRRVGANATGIQAHITQYLGKGGSGAGDTGAGVGVDAGVGVQSWGRMVYKDQVLCAPVATQQAFAASEALHFHRHWTMFRYFPIREYRVLVHPAGHIASENELGLLYGPENVYNALTGFREKESHEVLHSYVGGLIAFSRNFDGGGGGGAGDANASGAAPSTQSLNMASSSSQPSPPPQPPQPPQPQPPESSDGLSDKWALEGLTHLYGILAIDPEDAATMLNGDLQYYRRTLTNGVDAPLSRMARWAHTSNSYSYYCKGGLTYLYIDRVLRDELGAPPLTLFVRRLLEGHRALSAGERAAFGVTADDIRRELVAFAGGGATAEAAMQRVWDDYVHGDAVLPWVGDGVGGVSSGGGAAEISVGDVTRLMTWYRDPLG